MTKDSICGMGLESKKVAVGKDSGENAELRNLTRRFWIGAALAIPVFVLAIAHVIPAPAWQPWLNSRSSPWMPVGVPQISVNGTSFTE